MLSVLSAPSKCLRWGGLPGLASVTQINVLDATVLALEQTQKSSAFHMADVNYEHMAERWLCAARGVTVVRDAPLVITKTFLSVGF